MSHHAATLRSAFDKSASVLGFAYSVTDRPYWLNDNYVQPFYSWAAPRLREVAINGLYWALVTLIDVSLWLIDTTRQFMARDAHAIALHTFAHTHDPLSEFPALAPAAVLLALPSILPPMLPPMASTPEALDNVDLVLALCPAVLPIDFSPFLQPDDSVRRWLTSALPLVAPPWSAEAVPVSPTVIQVLAEVTDAAPMVKKFRRQSTNKATGNTKATEKTPRKRSQKKTGPAAQ